MTDILPTHQCFDDALDLLVEILKSEPDIYKRGHLITQWRLVHGRCLAPDGHSYAHAWVENTHSHTCYHVGLLNNERVILDAATPEYHAELRVQDCIRYTYPEALRLNRQHGHYGPWLDHLQSLCRKSKNQSFPVYKQTNAAGMA